MQGVRLRRGGSSAGAEGAGNQRVRSYKEAEQVRGRRIRSSEISEATRQAGGGRSRKEERRGSGVGRAF